MTPESSRRRTRSATAGAVRPITSPICRNERRAFSCNSFNRRQPTPSNCLSFCKAIIPFCLRNGLKYTIVLWLSTVNFVLNVVLYELYPQRFVRQSGGLMATNAATAQESISVLPGTDVQAHPNRRALVTLALLTVYIIWGTTYLGIRYALESFPPYLLMGIRFFVAGGGLLIVLRLQGAAMPTRKQWRSAMIVGGLLLLGGMGSVAMAEETVSSGLAAMLVATAPLWTLIISMRWGNRPGRMEWIGVAIGLLGVALLTLEGNIQANPGGVALIIFATLCWSLGSVWSKYLDMPKGAMGNAAEMFAGGTMLLVLGLLSGERIV